MGQRRDSQGRFARRLFSPSAPTAATPAPTRQKPQARKTPAVKLKYDPRVDADRLAKALDPNVGWLTRRSLRKELERQFGKIDWSATAPTEEVDQAETATVPVATSNKAAGSTIETLRAFSGATGNLWLRISEQGEQQFRKVAESARVEVRPADDSDADEPFAGLDHVLVFYGSIAERHFADDVLFYPTGR